MPIISNESKAALSAAAAAADAAIVNLASAWSDFLEAWMLAKNEAFAQSNAQLDAFKNCLEPGTFAYLIALRMRNVGLHGVLESNAGVDSSQLINDVEAAVNRRIEAL